NWAAQFADILEADRADVLSNPMRWLKEPVYRSGADRSLIAASQNARRSLLSLMSIRSGPDSAWSWTKQKLANGIYNVGGDRAVQVVEPLMWNNRTDPVAATRGLVFDAKLGLFAPIQLPLQA